jgi:RNA polymerase sigma-70 factor (ECF subfamily)
VSAPGFRVQAGPGLPEPGAAAPWEVVVSLAGFEDVYRAERSGLVRYLMTMGADQYQADDAVQAAFARAWSGWDVIGHPRGWLYRVALHEYYQADRRSREVPAGDELPDVPAPLDSGDIAVLNEEEEMVRAAVAALPGRQRQVMALLLAGFTTAQIAAELGCDQAAVRQSQVRARDALARRLGIDRRNPR